MVVSKIELFNNENLQLTIHFKRLLFILINNQKNKKTKTILVKFLKQFLVKLNNTKLKFYLVRIQQFCPAKISRDYTC